MWLRKSANVIEKISSPPVNVITHIGNFAIVLMMLITVVDIIGRRFFNSPLTGAYELSCVLLTLVAFSSIMFTEQGRGHITIGLIVDRFRQKTQDTINSINYFIFLVVTIILTYLAFGKAIGQIESGLITSNLKISIYPFTFFASLTLVLLCSLVLRSLLLLIAGVSKK